MFERRQVAAAVLLAASLGSVSYLCADDSHDVEGRNGIQHVLLISIDGMHALDFENCVESNTCPALKNLAKNGVNYTRTSTSRPSDSFPGLMALVTGGTPKTVGASRDECHQSGKRIRRPGGGRPRVVHAGLSEGLQSGTCIGTHAILEIEGVHAIDADQQNVLAVFARVVGQRGSRTQKRNGESTSSRV